MNKQIIFISIIFGCIILLIGSYMQWNNKISSSSIQSPKITSSTEITANTTENGEHNLLTLAENASPQVQAVIKARLNAGEKIDFLMIGSSAMTEGEPGYADRLKTALEEAYRDAVNITMTSLDTTSDAFIQNLSDEVALDAGYDIVLFEPFSINNNGVLTAEDQQQYINQFKNLLKEYVEDAELVLHPSQPLHNATFYPVEVVAIQDFANNNDIPYIDHWANWPASDSQELPNFLNENGGPNQAGAEVWANTLIHYFIAN